MSYDSDDELSNEQDISPVSVTTDTGSTEINIPEVGSRDEPVVELVESHVEDATAPVESAPVAEAPASERGSLGILDESDDETEALTRTEPEFVVEVPASERGSLGILDESDDETEALTRTEPEFVVEVPASERGSLGILDESDDEMGAPTPVEPKPVAEAQTNEDNTISHDNLASDHKSNDSSATFNSGSTETITFDARNDDIATDAVEDASQLTSPSQITQPRETTIESENNPLDSLAESEQEEVTQGDAHQVDAQAERVSAPLEGTAESSGSRSETTPIQEAYGSLVDDSLDSPDGSVAEQVINDTSATTNSGVGETLTSDASSNDYARSPMETSSQSVNSLEASPLAESAEASVDDSLDMLDDSKLEQESDGSPSETTPSNADTDPDPTFVPQESTDLLVGEDSAVQHTEIQTKYSDDANGECENRTAVDPAEEESDDVQASETLSGAALSQYPNTTELNETRSDSEDDGKFTREQCLALVKDKPNYESRVNDILFDESRKQEMFGEATTILAVEDELCDRFGQHAIERGDMDSPSDFKYGDKTVDVIYALEPGGSKRLYNESIRNGWIEQEDQISAHLDKSDCLVLNFKNLDVDNQHKVMKYLDSSGIDTKRTIILR